MRPAAGTDAPDPDREFFFPKRLRSTTRTSRRLEGEEASYPAELRQFWWVGGKPALDLYERVVGAISEGTFEVVADSAVP